MIRSLVGAAIVVIGLPLCLAAVGGAIWAAPPFVLVLVLLYFWARSWWRRFSIGFAKDVQHELHRRAEEDEALALAEFHGYGRGEHRRPHRGRVVSAEPQMPSIRETLREEAAQRQARAEEGGLPF